MDMLINIFEYLDKILDFSLVKLGSTRITLWLILYFFSQIFLLFYLAGKIRVFLSEKLLIHSHLDIGARQAVGTISRYIVIVLGFLIILQTVGLNLTTFNVIAGAVSVGIGFGLQNIASNFISGLIILFERPIKVGDRIEVAGVIGDVIAIAARSTTVRTNDNIAIIVPNSKFVTENVINWQYTDETLRFRIPVSVSYNSNIEKVKELLLEIAKENNQVLSDPPSSVRFLSFGDNGLNFELCVWSTTASHRRGTLLSELNFAIFSKFTDNAIEFPYPQRDLHIRSGVLEINNLSKLVGE